jgi:exodeoxyribonuclease VII large subunit
MNRSEATTAITVSELNRQVRSLLENSFMTLRVVGEISNFARPSSGHWYFTLKDGKAQVRCAMFRNRNLQVRFRPREGDQVVVQARVSLYEGRGDFQLICEQMQESGLGQLQLAYEALKQKLADEGLFATSRKRPIPAPVRHVGIITSPSGAAIHDILTVLQRRCPGLPVALYPVAVQGSEAAGQIVRAIELANRDQRCDLLIVGRGGGSLEDLWPFNEEAVARAIAASRIPIVSAVGHEVDVAISDLVADLRAPTPSAAAELISPDQQVQLQHLANLRQRLQRQMALQLQRGRERLDHLRLRLRHPSDRLREQSQRLDQLEQRLQRALQRQLQSHRRRLDTLQQRLRQVSPARLLEHKGERLHPLRLRLHAAISHLLERRQLQLQGLGRELHSVSPLATLERGYAIIQSSDGTAITASTQVAPGEQVTARLHRGRLLCRIEQSSD